MKYCKNYCVENGISTSKLNEAQSTLYYMAENMKMNKSISEQGYRHFQMAIEALQESVLEQIRAEIEQLYTVDTVYEDVVAVDKADVLQIIDRYKGV